TWRNFSFIAPLNRFGLLSITLTAILCRPHRLRCLRILRGECGSGKFFIICSKPFVSSLGYLHRSCPTPQRSCNVSLGSKKAMQHIASLGASVSHRVIRSTVQLFFSRALNSLAKLSGLPRDAAKWFRADR